LCTASIIIYVKLSEITRWKQEKVDFNKLEKLERWVDRGCFFSMTEINKLGINPQSKYNTPLGIYSYPLNEEYKKRLLNNKLPFAGDKPFVQIFRPITFSNILTLNFGDGKYNEYIDELYDMLQKIKPGMTHHELAGLIGQAERTARIKTPAGKLWNVTRLLSDENPVKWRRLFLNFLIDGCYDPGNGIIHPSEPTQAVFFKTSIIEHLDTIDNPTLSRVVGTVQWLFKEFKKNAQEGNIKWLVKNIGKIVSLGEWSLTELIDKIPVKVILKLLAYPDFITEQSEFRHYADAYLMGVVGDDAIRNFVRVLVKSGQRDNLDLLLSTYERRVKQKYYEPTLQDIFENVVSIMKEELQ
jgi:hypothetical protein